MENVNLKEVGLKVTGPRLKILKIFESNQSMHLSAEDIYKLLAENNEDVGLATIYRVLNQFEAAGLVIRHNFDSTNAVYELADSQHHDHFVCNKCGKVEEFFDEVIESRQKEIAKKLNFTISYHNLTMFGVCKNCEK